ncbi:SWIM zinc finger family protein [Streptomyces sp. TRM70308]|uniref:SWIM zinc finger family protein n=1 Tax=Streptomyces sp. TRM70308 TaxID=3131932 RepID=UPI003CFC2C1C
MEALEGSTLDAGRLSRGRTYARAGAVEEVTVRAGVLRAEVRGSGYHPYRTAVRLPVLSDAQWERLLAATAAVAAHAAALLDGEMPRFLADAAEAADSPLLPRPDELEPSCSCPDWGRPCKHAAALCYAVAATIDHDPFALFALRGRTRRQVLGELERRRAPVGTGAPEAPVGVPAAAAYARWAQLPRPTAGPETTDPPAAVDRCAPVPLEDPPPDSGLTADGLATLIADTAGRARELLTGDVTSLGLTVHQDAVRLTTTHRSPEYFHGLVSGTGLRPLELARRTRAWRHGGLPGLAACEDVWTPERATLAAARHAVADTLADMAAPNGDPPPVRTWRNRITAEHSGVQLRLGPDGRWYPYVRDDGAWWPCAPPAADPVDALTAAWEARP